MKAQTVNVRESTGRVLSCTIFRAGGKKLLAKGHVISEEDVKLLEVEGMNEVWVTELEEGEVGEDDAVMLVANEMGCGSLEIRLAAGGRANLMATEPTCVLVDDDLLKQINCTATVAIATVPNFSYTSAEQRIATIKSAPFAVAKDQLEAVISILKDKGPILQARPVRNPTVAVLYTDPVSGERARQLFEGVMRQRLERFGAGVSFALASVGDIFGSLFAVATGLLVIESGALPRWLGWVSIVAGILLFLQGFTLGGVISDFGVLVDIAGFVLLLVFVLVSSIIMLSRGASGVPTPTDAPLDSRA